MRPVTQDRIVLFCDCHQFSRLMAELGSVAFAFLDEMYNLCGECIVSHRGRIVKYMGDAILAVFEADHALGAVAAGHTMRVAYAKLLVRHRATVESEMEVGLAFGPVTEGVVGHPTHRGFDVFGEAVCEATVIGHCRGIAITDGFRSRLPSEVAVRQIEPARPKWRSEPIRLWQVLEPEPA